VGAKNTRQRATAKAIAWGSLSGARNRGAPRGARAQRQPDKAKGRPAATDEGMIFKPAFDCKKNATLEAKNSGTRI